MNSNQQEASVTAQTSTTCTHTEVGVHAKVKCDYSRLHDSLGVLVKEGAADEVIHGQELASCELTLLCWRPPVQQNNPWCNAQKCMVLQPWMNLSMMLLYGKTYASYACHFAS